MLKNYFGHKIEEIQKPQQLTEIKNFANPL